MIKIGITGGIASGKSTVTEYLRQKGYTVIDADEGARVVVDPHTKGWHQVKEQFGEAFFNSDATINRQKLGNYIFKHPKARQSLEAIMHPLIFQWIDEQIHLCNQSVVFIDMPLLYEVEYQQFVDRVWVVYVPKQMQIERLMMRNHLTEAVAQQRLDAQYPIEQKRQLADVVLDNQGDLPHLYQQVDQLLGQLP